MTYVAQAMHATLTRQDDPRAFERETRTLRAAKAFALTALADGALYVAIWRKRADGYVMAQQWFPS